MQYRTYEGIWDSAGQHTVATIAKLASDFGISNEKASNASNWVAFAQNWDPPAAPAVVGAWFSAGTGIILKTSSRANIRIGVLYIGDFVA